MNNLPADFDWDTEKDKANSEKHGVSFRTAQYAFSDSRRVIAFDKKHSTPSEQRFFCYGKIGDRIMTVRFTIRSRKTRIFGAGYWRQGRKKYYEKNKLH